MDVLGALDVQAVDHVGIAVPDLDEASAFFASIFGLVDEHQEINEEQGVREAMLAAPEGTTRIQLLAPPRPDSTIGKVLARRGTGLHQLALRVSEVTEAGDRLRAAGMRVIYDTPRRGTAGSLVNFVHPKDCAGVLLELVEPASGH